MPDVPTPPASEDREALIKRQQEEIARLRDTLTRVERERDRLERRNERLQDQLDAARASGRPPRLPNRIARAAAVRRAGEPV